MKQRSFHPPAPSVRGGAWRLGASNLFNSAWLWIRHTFWKSKEGKRKQNRRKRRRRQRRRRRRKEEDEWTKEGQQTNRTWRELSPQPQCVWSQNGWKGTHRATGLPIAVASQMKCRALSGNNPLSESKQLKHIWSYMIIVSALWPYMLYVPTCPRVPVWLPRCRYIGSTSHSSGWGWDDVRWPHGWWFWDGSFLKLLALPRNQATKNYPFWWFKILTYLGHCSHPVRTQPCAFPRWRLSVSPNSFWLYRCSLGPGFTDDFVGIWRQKIPM